MEEELTLTAFALFALLAAISPIILAIIASVKLHRTFGKGAIFFLSIGTILIGLLPLDTLASVAIARMDNDILAQVMLYKSYVVMALTYLGSVSISVGILMLCHQYQTKA
ncbi:hypothetical protein [Pseudoalteromonas sp. BDTF-M6]|uniref:hypothetical protein n=1 Tax=Pseudoalteromonas sp. BDTF-M6 TaxID=2796132 RepID=UPI001BB00AD2|nr:hypothetical protein [Pseudoalteromonas sp. BDTF-M6]MBS3798862.1 hypothetical protein [Pseudoalteromonas sp. BDTF-M6]